MEKTYSPQNIEGTWYQYWEKEGLFEPKGEGKPYCIMLPPPNVTGSLHMGHGFQHTLMDVLIRYNRMQGHDVLWQAGLDHAGISTQMVVERELNRHGQSRLDFSREEFEQKIWDWKAVSGGNISRQMRRMGSSLDWSRERFTLDPKLSAAVQKVFVQLYHEGLIYRGQRLVNWDPKLGTAVSDLEVIPTETQGSLWSIHYPFSDSAGNAGLTVATTRPETIFGDVAVAVNPNDERYAGFIGRMLKLPLTERLIPIIADEYVDSEFGTGCVKITPAHDFNDYEMGKRHGLGRINILNKDATLNQEVPLEYQGLDRFVARKKVIEALTQQGLLIETKPHTHKIPKGEKTDCVIEPYLTEQWYVSMKPLAEPAIEAVRQEKIKFIPEQWTKTYYQWMENIEDWCISRQLWWGHRIPAWYDESGEIYVGYNEEDVRFRYKITDNRVLTQDNDVLDTWFSSSLWPFSTLGWPEKTQDFQTFYPSQVLVTGFDIIFFWVARMVAMGLKFTGKVPFNEVYITGLIRDSEGQKMSKSKGNVLDPIDIIDGIDLETLLEKRTAHLMLDSQKNKIIESTKKTFPKGIGAYGTDALRFTFCALASPTRNINFDMNRVEGYRNFCNKLWNATRYVVMNTEQEEDNSDFEDGAFQYSSADKYILSRLQVVIQEAREAFLNYRFDYLAQILYDFTWHEYCDWYLECSKVILNSETSLDAMKRGTRNTLIQVLEIILRLLHPIIPFITEELWQKVGAMAGCSGKSIMKAHYPKVKQEFLNPEIEKNMAWLKEMVLSVRNIRGEMNISPAKELKVLVDKGSDEDMARIKRYRKYLVKLAKLESIQWLKDMHEKPALSATALVGNLEILVSLEGVVDNTAEKERLNREIAKLQQSLAHSEKQLSNPNFIERAPAALVEKERVNQAEMKLAIGQLEKKLADLV